MGKFRNLSIGKKSGLIVLLSITIISLVLIIYNAVSFNRSINREFEERILALGENLSDVIAGPLSVILSFGDEFTPEMLSTLNIPLKAVVDRKDIVYAILIHKGKELTQANRFGDKGFKLPDGRDTGKSFGRFIVREVNIQGNINFEIRIPVKKENDVLGEVAIGFDNSSIIKTIRNSLFFSILLTVVIAIFLMLSAISLIFKMVIKPIQETVTMAEHIASGNLSVQEIDIKTHDEIGTLGKALNRMKNNLKDMIGKVKEGAGEVSAGAEDISKLSDSASSGTEKQTSQITQVVAAMEEMSSTITEVAKNTADAANSANKAKESAATGSKVVQSSIEGMERIAKSVESSAKTIKELGKSSNQIGEIVAVIDDIADQTNLLALNAAIEAARAGEQGRGFAVVADEVRKLADRTTKATKEIADMVKKIQRDTADAVAAMNEWNREVKNGVELSNSAGESLKQIVGLAQNVTDMVNQIATATEEQSAASEEITSNMGNISNVSKETATGASITSEAAKNLKRLSDNLQKLVAQFKL